MASQYPQNILAVEAVAVKGSGGTGMSPALPGTFEVTPHG